MLIDYKNLEPKKRYKVMSSSVIPRPIAWIVTLSSENIVNIAPFSYFTPLSSEPASLIISIGHKSNKEPKDTLKNIRDSKKATICLVNEKNFEKMHFSSKELDKSISEASEFDIELETLSKGFPPMIKDSDCAFFCDFLQEVDIKGQTRPIILEIKEQFLADGVSDEKLNIELKNIARVGREYSKDFKILNAPDMPK